MTYKECTQEVDNLVTSGDYDPNHLYKLLQKIIKYQICNKKYILNKIYHADFVDQTTSDIYMRLINKELTPITSIDMYLKKTMRGFYTNFCQREFSQVIDTNLIKDPEQRQNTQTGLADYITSSLQVVNTPFDSINCDLYLKYIPRTIRNLLKNNKYCKDSATDENIYLSILLTLINKLTLSQKQLEKIKHIKENKKLLQQKPLIDKIIYNNEDSSLINFKLDKEISEYVSLLYEHVQSNLKKDMRDLNDNFNLSDDELLSVLYSEFYEGDPDEE